jgi:hypothetical protein
MPLKKRLLAVVPLAALHTLAHAKGVTPYLPLNLDPEIERQIERVLVLGDKPVMTRPIAAARVLEALPKACKADAVLCEHVRKYLSRYMRGMGVEFASVGVAATHGSNLVLPNEHGESAQSHYDASFGGYWQPSDYALLNVGGVAYQGRVTPTGSVLSLGFDFAQLDIGWRDHWWSPMTDSSVLLSTEAPTMPSVSLSNYEPLTRLGFTYELYLGRMSKSDKIELTNGDFTTGYPKVGGLRLGFEPMAGWSISAQRILIFGGGAAGGQSVSDILQAFFNPSKAQSSGFGASHVVGKQEASITSRFLFPGPVPFAVYAEYAGNDTDAGRNYLFGKPVLSMGIHFPHVGPFDVTFEDSHFAPTWYVHTYSPVQTGYGDGITNDGDSFGGWFGDQRVFGESVGGRSNLLRVGWEPPFGGRMEAQLRTLVNEDDSFFWSYSYKHEFMGALSYAYPWHGYAVGAEIDVGCDVFGDRYTRLEGFVRVGEALREAGDAGAGDDALGLERPDGAEIFVDAGINVNEIDVDLTGITKRYVTPAEVAPHIGIGARREVTAHQDFGARLEVDEMRGHTLYTFRALDYRYRFNNPLALGLFAGAARYDLVTPAFGFVVGAGGQWRNVLPGWDLNLDYRYGVKVARERDLSSDSQRGTRPDSFYDISALGLYVSRKF